MKISILRKIKSEVEKAAKDPFNDEDCIISDSYIEFKMLRFLKFFFYHMLFLLITGPFSIVVLIFFETKIFIINMGFWGNSLSFYY